MFGSVQKYACMSKYVDFVVGHFGLDWIFWKVRVCVYVIMGNIFAIPKLLSTCLLEYFPAALHSLQKQINSRLAAVVGC